ncbi:hypothetical protein MKC93_25060 [[Clostridium] innocuum]|nr:hypothetical protein HMPREF0982_02953 [Erysipelotrichaceae bacterium 21_3]MCR0181215.1 hypothetical protein [[Clostridium] innocuum]MCR0194809.1 hypothetical protein [[Clostridium] innocuum]
MPGKLEIDIKGKGAYDIAGSNFGNMMPSEYVELAAAFTAAAAGKSGVPFSDIMMLIQRRAQYLYAQNQLDIMDEKVQKGLEKTPKV